jgi:nucleotide-binding universal stress UspA family protein
VETKILAGQPDEVLGARVEEAGASIVVMGAYGHSRIRSFVIGSTTSEMLSSLQGTGAVDAVRWGTVHSCRSVGRRR